MEDLENATGIFLIVEFSYGFKEYFPLRIGNNIVSYHNIIKDW